MQDDYILWLNFVQSGALPLVFCLNCVKSSLQIVEEKKDGLKFKKWHFSALLSYSLHL